FGGTALQAIVGQSAGWVAIGVLAAVAIAATVRHIVRRRRKAPAEPEASTAG
ncbi:MAG: hypothetical protein JWM70_173, partial [Microbacteriaceae bacterium]|nr:hypothetical protein [Microbacteriaceae bacterium]